MKLFILGFLAATAIFAGLLFAQSRGATVFFENTCCVALKECNAETPVEEAEMVEEGTDSSAENKRRRGRRRARQQAGAPLSSEPGYQPGDGQVGDDLSAGAREAAMNGSEAQLSNADIDQGIDRAFNGIQRCLTLMPPDAPSAGTVKIGMRIDPAGTVTKVNLKGANAMIQGECGACLRRTVKGIRFRSFDGPEMTVHYPITFD